MIISKPVITKDNNQSKITFKIEAKNFDESLCCEIDSKYQIKKIKRTFKEL